MARADFAARGRSPRWDALPRSDAHAILLDRRANEGALRRKADRRDPSHARAVSRPRPCTALALHIGMGQLVDGQWKTGWYEPNAVGAFERPKTRFRSRIAAEGE